MDTTLPHFKRLLQKKIYNHQRTFTLLFDVTKLFLAKATDFSSISTKKGELSVMY